MARPLRIEGAGLWYHVMCRGNGGQHVVTDDRDREAFLGRLGTVAGAFRVEIHAYALKGTHLHLFGAARAEWGQACNVQYDLTKAVVNAIIGIWHDHCA